MIADVSSRWNWYSAFVRVVVLGAAMILAAVSVTGWSEVDDTSKLLIVFGVALTVQRIESLTHEKRKIAFAPSVFTLVYGCTIPITYLASPDIAGPTQCAMVACVLLFLDIVLERFAP